MLVALATVVMLAAAPAKPAAPVKAATPVPPGSDKIRKIKSLYPAGKITSDGTLTGIARDGIPGSIAEADAYEVAVADGSIVAFLLRLDDGDDKTGKYLQVVHFDKKGKYLETAPAPFPMGGWWLKSECCEMASEPDLALLDLSSIRGTNRAVILSYTPTTTNFSSDQFLIVAIDGAGKLVLSESFGEGKRHGGDGSWGVTTWSNFRAEEGAIYADVLYEPGEIMTDHEPEDLEPRRTPDKLLFTLP